MSEQDYLISWIVWVVWFIAVEGQAIHEGYYEGKLTYRIRQFFAMHGKPRWWRFRRAALVGMLAWLSAHFLAPQGMF